jgi:hypothetical protein
VGVAEFKTARLAIFLVPKDGGEAVQRGRRRVEAVAFRAA